MDDDKMARRNVRISQKERARRRLEKEESHERRLLNWQLEQDKGPAKTRKRVSRKTEQANHEKKRDQSIKRQGELAKTVMESQAVQKAIKSVPSKIILSNGRVLETKRFAESIAYGGKQRMDMLAEIPAADKKALNSSFINIVIAERERIINGKKGK